MRFILLIVLLCGLSGAAFAQDQERGFGDWLGKFRAEALRAGISPATFDMAMADVQPIPRIIDLDHAQPETKLQFSDYVRRLSSQQRRAGVEQHLAAERDVLNRVGRRFHVQPRFIVALFTRELIAALRIVQRDGIPPAKLRGSWAGAMGQCQFMPSSFLEYAVR